MSNDKELNPMEEMEAQVLEELFSAIIPKIRKYIPKIRDELSKFLGDDEKILQIRKEGDELYFIVIETSGIKSFDLKEDSIKVHKIDSFIEILLSGDLSKLG